MSFSRIRHQSSAVRMLRAAVAGDRVSHAYLFVGPRGVGKGLAARELAKLLFCESARGADADNLDPCDACAACGRVDRDVHPDLHWFRKEADRNDFRIELVARREGSPESVVTESVILTPMEAPLTVTVLDDAELLNAAAANALLKTLEEPSPHALLILLCADASRLPGTIHSRCQWVRFRPLPEAFVAEKVREVLAARQQDEAGTNSRSEKPEPVSSGEIDFVCRFAGGSIEGAAGLAGSGLWDLKQQLIAGLPDIDAGVALDMAEQIKEWGRALARREHIKADTPEANAVRRRSARLGLAAVASAFGDAAVLAAGGDVAGGLVNADQRREIEALVAWPAELGARAVGLLADGQTQIGRYVHTELATENALIQVGRLRPSM